MFFRGGLAASMALTMSTLGAVAQVDSDGLDDVNPWGFGFLAENEQALPETFWAASSAEDLLPLMRRARTRNLSPAERTLLRRIVLSPGIKPGGEQDDDLLAARAQLMFDLGEAAAAARLMPELQKSPSGLDAEEVSVDLLLALGQEASACANGEGETRDGAFWAKLRAVCFALQGNASGAELAVELAAAQGVDDPWFFNAVFAASGDLPEPPPARFDSGLALALSAKAGLKPPINAIASSRPDLAAAMARRTSLPADLRVQAAGVAAESGLIPADAHREAYQSLLAMDDFNARTPLEIAMVANWQSEEDIATKARTLRAALQTAEGNIARYSAVARLLQKDISALPKTPETTRMALPFARASLASGDLSTATAWVEAVSEDESVFDIAWIEGLILLASETEDSAQIAAVSNRLLAASSGKARDAAMHRLFVLWSAFDIPLNSAARADLAKAQADMANAVPPFLLRSINAAADEDAAGEVILRSLEATSGIPYDLPGSDMAQIAEALRTVGAEDAARMLALENTGYWRSAL